MPRSSPYSSSEQTFVNGIDLKKDLAKLGAHYESLPEDVLKTGLIHFAAYPPEDTAFLVTCSWDKYLPRWREIRDMPKPPRDPEGERRVVEEINRQTDSPELQPHDEHADGLALSTANTAWRQRSKSTAGIARPLNSKRSSPAFHQR